MVGWLGYTVNTNVARQVIVLYPPHSLRSGYWIVRLVNQITCYSHWANTRIALLFLTNIHLVNNFCHRGVDQTLSHKIGTAVPHRAKPYKTTKVWNSSYQQKLKKRLSTFFPSYAIFYVSLLFVTSVAFSSSSVGWHQRNFSEQKARNKQMQKLIRFS